MNKKKVLTVLGAGLLSVGLTACGSQGEGGNGDNDKNDSKDTSAKTEKKQQKKVVKPKVESKHIQTYQSVGSTVYQYNAVIKNEGDEKIRVEPYTLTVKDKDGNVIDNVDADVTPMYIKPGEKAYVSTDDALDGLKKDNYGESSANIDFEAAPDRELLMMDSKNVKADDKKISGEIENKTGKTAKDIEIMVAAYDKDNKLVKTAHEFADNDLDDGNSEGFTTDLDGPGEVDHVKVKSQGYVN